MVVTPVRTSVHLKAPDFLAEDFGDEVVVFFRASGDTHLLDGRAYDLLCLLRQTPQFYEDLIALFPEGIEFLDQYLQSLSNIGIIQQH